jgi:hypothetical protein
MHEARICAIKYRLDESILSKIASGSGFSREG